MSLSDKIATTEFGNKILTKDNVKEFIKRLKKNGISLKGEHGKYVSFQIIDHEAGKDLI